MTEYSAQQLIDRLKELEITPDFYSLLGFSNTAAKKISAAIPELGNIKVLEYEGGGEGVGEDSHIVVDFIDQGVILRSNGPYWSTDGVDWSPWYQVFPKAVEVIKYVDIHNKMY